MRYICVTPIDLCSIGIRPKRNVVCRFPDRPYTVYYYHLVVTLKCFKILVDLRH